MFSSPGRWMVPGRTKASRRVYRSARQHRRSGWLPIRARRVRRFFLEASYPVVRLYKVKARVNQKLAPTPSWKKLTSFTFIVLIQSGTDDDGIAFLGQSDGFDDSLLEIDKRRCTDAEASERLEARCGGSIGFDSSRLTPTAGDAHYKTYSPLGLV